MELIIPYIYVLKAFKPCICCECSRTIETGETYERTAIKFSDIRFYSTCSDCSSIRDAFFHGDGVCNGRMFDALGKKMSKITEEAKRKMLKLLQRGV